jgi:hypothetical protein
MDILNLNKALKIAAQCLPDGFPDEPKAVFRYEKLMLAYWNNTKQMANKSKQEIEKILASECACSRFPSCYTDKDHKHVISNDPEILGSKFRTGLHYGNFTTAHRNELLHTGISNKFIYQSSRRRGLGPALGHVETHPDA